MPAWPSSKTRWSTSTADGDRAGPDFPTGGHHQRHRAASCEAYRTGRGRIYVRARTDIETEKRSGRDTIIVTRAALSGEQGAPDRAIAELVKEKKLEGIAELRDESDKDGMRMVIELQARRLSATWC
jgi:DNA gyrase subunit A